MKDDDIDDLFMNPHFLRGYMHGLVCRLKQADDVAAVAEKIVKEYESIFKELPYEKAGAND